MAQRRMFSIHITDSARFLKMPESAQALYFHLCMHADDDGVVEAFTVMRLIGSNDDNLKILAAKSLVKILNEDLVSYICDFNEHNLIRADRKKDSVHQELLLQIIPEAPLKISKQRSDRVGTSQCQPNVSVVEGSIGEYSKGEKSKDIRHKHGEYKHVLLTDSQLEKLKIDFPENWKAMIKNLDEYLENHKKKSYSNHNLTMRNWANGSSSKKTNTTPVPDWGVQ